MRRQIIRSRRQRISNRINGRRRRTQPNEPVNNEETLGSIAELPQQIINPVNNDDTLKDIENLPLQISNDSLTNQFFNGTSFN